MNNKDILMKLIAMMIGEESHNDTSAESPEKQMIGEYVIVRCVNAGVHAGTLKSYEGTEVVLSNSRRLWYWVCMHGHSLSGVADQGINSEKSKITAPVENIVLTDACEILSVKIPAKDTIVGAEIHDCN